MDYVSKHLDILREAYRAVRIHLKTAHRWHKKYWQANMRNTATCEAVGVITYRDTEMWNPHKLHKEGLGMYMVESFFSKAACSIRDLTQPVSTTMIESTNRFKPYFLTTLTRSSRPKHLPEIVGLELEVPAEGGSGTASGLFFCITFTC